MNQQAMASAASLTTSPVCGLNTSTPFTFTRSLPPGSGRSVMSCSPKITKRFPLTPFCLSSGDSCSVDLPATLSDEREDLSGEVTLQGSNGVEFGMPFGYPTSNIVLGSLVGP